MKDVIFHYNTWPYTLKITCGGEDYSPLSFRSCIWLSPMLALTKPELIFKKQEVENRLLYSFLPNLLNEWKEITDYDRTYHIWWLIRCTFLLFFSPRKSPCLRRLQVSFELLTSRVLVLPLNYVANVCTNVNKVMITSTPRVAIDLIKWSCLNMSVPILNFLSLFFGKIKLGKYSALYTC